MSEQPSNKSAWRPQPVEFLGLMRPVKPWPLQIERFSKGIDNAHIDVFLSPRFIAICRTFVGRLVRQDAGSWMPTEAGRGVDLQNLEEFRSAYQGIMEQTLGPHRQLLPADWVRLAQLAIFKFLLLLVPEEIRKLRSELAAQRDEDEAMATGRRLEYHQHLVSLTRHAYRTTYRVYQLVFKVARQIETSYLRKVRQSLLGIPWPLPQEALFNKLLVLPNLLSAEDVMHHYPLLFFEDQGKQYLQDLNNCIVQVLHHYLPSWVRASDSHPADQAPSGPGGGFRIIHRVDQGMLPGFLETEIILSPWLSEEEYRTPQYSWLDDTQNLELLLGVVRPTLRGGDREVVAPRPLPRQWQAFRREIRRQLHERIAQIEIGPRIPASYWTPRIFKQLGGKVSARVVYQVLSGQLERSKTLRRPGTGSPGLDPAQAIRIVDLAAAAIRQLTPRDWARYYSRLLIDFLALRRDLKLAYKTFESMDRIRLCMREDDINLSRTNGLLHEVTLPDEQVSAQRIGHHVILKADVRGSTRITSELRARKLNPATHFSQNFFYPINTLLPDFGASKVFVEGDAVILSLAEPGDENRRSLVVARACGLARKILEIVSRQNIVNRKHQLPEIELGMGIAYCSEDPTFLYDEDKKIMISPAINLADRLSSCSPRLRNTSLAHPDRPYRVEVALPAASPECPADASSELLRYNVNGIELDPAAFGKLRTELVLSRLDLEVEGRTERFFVGSFPDRANKVHWLVIREAPVQVWRDQGFSREATSHHRFFEVIADPALLNLIRSRLPAALGGDTPSRDIERSSRPLVG